MGSDANHENHQKILWSQLDGLSHNDISHPLLNLRRRNQKLSFIYSWSCRRHEGSVLFPILFAIIVTQSDTSCCFLFFGGYSLCRLQERLWSHLTASYSLCSFLITTWPRKKMGPKNAAISLMPLASAACKGKVIEIWLLINSDRGESCHTWCHDSAHQWE